MNLVDTRYHSESDSDNDLTIANKNIKINQISLTPSVDNLEKPQLDRKNEKYSKDETDYSQKNLKINVEKTSMDNYSFDEQFLTFKNFNHVSDAESATVFRGDINLLKKKKYRRPERETSGNPSEVDGYRGPWARYKEDEDIIAERNAKQKRMKEIFENKNETGRKEGDQNSEKDGEKNTADGELPKDDETKASEKIDAKETDEKTTESTVFEYIAERDYQGRTYMHCPHEYRNNDPDHRCYVPTKRVHTWYGHTKPVNTIRWFPKTGHILVSASMDRTIKIWDVNSHRRCLRTITGHSKGVKDVTFNADGTKFMSVGLDQWIKIWDTETGKSIARFNPEVQTQCARFYPPNDNEFLAAQIDKLVVGWDVREGKVTQKYSEHLRAVNALTFIDHNRKFVSSGDDKKLYVWEYGIPVVVNHITEPYMNSVPYLTGSPDGEWFIGQSMDNSVVVYSSADKRRHKKRRYVGHTSGGYGCQVDVSPDGQFIVSGDANGKMFFWDWKTKKIYKRLNAHEKVTIGVIWHPVHTSKVASCSWDSTIKLWD